MAGLHHVVLPWNRAGFRTAPVFEEVTQLLSLSVVGVGDNCFLRVHQVVVLSPGPRYDVVVGVFPIHQVVLHSRVADAHQVVQNHCGCHYQSDS